MYNYIGPTAETEKDTGLDRKNVLGLLAEEVRLNCINMKRKLNKITKYSYIVVAKF